MASRFVPGLELSRSFYTEAVRPLLGEAIPSVPHSAALLGAGSEVLGFDTERSTDHDWGPRLQLFLRADDAPRHAARLSAILAGRLPRTFRGYATSFTPASDPRVGRRHDTGRPVRHRVEITDPGTWFSANLGFDPRGRVTLLDWLATPTQRLAEATGGAVFHDGLGELNAARANLTWYPRDVWRYLLACQWQRIAQEEAFPGRCGEAGDELGSAVVTARLVRDLMRLCLLMACRYPPYSKWLGSAFARTSYGPQLTPVLTAAIAATGWRAREQHLGRAYEMTAAAHNKLGLTAALDPAVRPYHDRPFLVLRAERFTAALTSRITDAVVRALPLAGAVDQHLDSTDALGSQRLTRAAARASLTACRPSRHWQARGT
jgi:uncharacterized protein DUF4037